MPWNNGNVDTTIFNAAGVGTIVVAPSITAGSLWFNANGYVLNSGTLTLAAGGSGSLFAGEVLVGTGFTSTINSVVAGNVMLRKRGQGRSC